MQQQPAFQEAVCLIFYFKKVIMLKMYARLEQEKNMPSLSKNYSSGNSAPAISLNLFKISFMRKIVLLSVLLASLFSISLKAQVTVTGDAAGSYSDLATALSLLPATLTQNTVVSVDPGNPQTAPAGGYVITTTGTPSFSLTISGNSNTVTAAAGLTAGNINDAVFKIVGGDYITLQGFTINENANTAITVASNTMTEFAIALYAASTTDGAKNNTIQNNTINMGTAGYTQSYGILSTSNFSSANGTTVTTQASVAGGENSNNKIYGNNISNVAFGIFVLSPVATATFSETGLDIGGSTPLTGNTISYRGNANVTSAFTTIASTSIHGGIIIRNNVGVSIRYNTITSGTISTAAVSTNGITVTASTTPAGVTYTNTISNNTVTLTSSTNTSGTLYGIDFGYGLSTGTLAASNNTVTINQNSTAAISGAIIGIKGNYTSAGGTFNTNNITINQAHAPTATATNSSAVTTLTLPGAVVNSSSTVNALSNTILLNRTVTAGTGVTGTISGTFTGIQATSADSVLNIGSAGNGNTITFKEAAVSGAGTATYTSTVTFIDAGTTHRYAHIVSNTLNTTGSTIRSTGTATAVACSATVTGVYNIKGNSAIFDRVAASGTIQFTNQTGSPSNVADTVSNNTITYTSLAGTTVATGISQLGGPSTSGIKNLNNNTISITGTNTGTTKGITWGYSGGAKVQGNSITISNAAATIIALDGSGSSAGSGFFVPSSGPQSGVAQFGGVAFNTISLTSSTTSPTSMIGINLAGAGPHKAFNNTFTTLNFSGAITGSPVVSGITCTAGTADSIYNNTVTNISVGAAGNAATPTVSGITLGAATSTFVFKNKIYGITTPATGTTTVVNGILISAGTTHNVYNNLIGDLTAPAAASTDALRGISITSTTTSSTRNISFNTIYLNGSSTGANFGSSGIYHVINTTATTSSLVLNNNNIVNVSTPAGTGLTVVYRRSGGAASNLANYAGTSNKNNFYTDTLSANRFIYHDGTSSAVGFTPYKNGVFTAGTIAPRDAQSFSENPTFLSTTGSSSNFLHISPLVSTLLESGGSTIAGITDDYDGDTRNVTTPDVGADEFAGLSPAPVITFNSLTPGTNQCVAAPHVVSVTATTPSGTITGVTITYNNGTLNSNVPMTNTSGNIWEYTIPVASPANTSVSWSVTATNSLSISTLYTGTAYADEPLTGVTATAAASVNPVCAGSPTVLTATLSKLLSGTLGTGGTTASSYDGIFYHLFGGNKSQFLVRASELTALGITAGNLTSLGINMSTVTSASYAGFAINIAPTALTNLTSTLVSTGFTQVYAANPYSPTTGINTFAFGTGAGSSNTFAWDGTSNIVIQFCWSNNNGGGTSNFAKIDATGFTSCAYYRSDSQTPAVLCGTTAATGTTTNRPQFIFAGNAAPAITSVSWDNGAGTGNPVTVSPAGTTTYTGTVTAAGCTINTNALPVNVTPLPSAPGTGSFPSFQCGTATPDGFVTGGSTNEYRWYLSAAGMDSIPGQWNATLSSYPISISTPFWVSIVSSGCESPRTSVNANVIPPDPIQASSNGPVCVNAALQLTATVTSGTNGNNYSYSWSATPNIPAGASGINGSTSGGTGTFGSPANTSVTPTTAGSYTYTVTGTDGSCTATSSVIVTVNAAPTIDSIKASSATVCSGSPVTLNVYSAGGLLSGPQTPPTGYCSATFTFSTAEDEIGQVTFAGINNPAVRPTPQQSNATETGHRYTDYTAIPAATVITGQSYPFTLYHIHGTTDASTNFANVYIDFNRNGVFTDAGETFNLSKPGATFLEDFVGTIAIPANASLGLTRMRVVVREGAISTPCGDVGTWGEAEDYLVDIQKVNPQNPSLTYSWSPVAGSSPTLTGNPTVNPTVYSVQVTGANGCSANPSVSVSVLPLPDAPIGTNSQQCGTGVPTASVATGGANGSGVYKWYLVPTGGTAIAGESGTSLVSYTISLPTSFYVSEVGTNGCESPRTQVDVSFDLIPDELTISASPSPICLGQSTTFTVGQTGGANSFIFNYPSTSHVSGSGINIPNIEGVDSSLLDANITITPTAAGTYTYTVSGFDPDKGCTSVATTTVTVNPLPTIASVTAQPATICEGGSSVLTAVTMGSPTTGTIGSGTVSNTTSTPYKGFWGGSKVQMIYTAAELTTLGLSAGSQISAVGFNISAFTSPYTFNDFTIAMKNTTTSVVTTTLETGVTTVLAPSSYTLTGTAPFTTSHAITPFTWDGTSNLLVEFCFTNGIGNSGGSSGNSANVTSTTTASNLTVYFSQDNSATQCSAPGTGTITTTRPNLRLTYTPFNGGSYTWSWNNGAGSGNQVSVSPTSTVTDYHVTATDGNNCSVTSTPDISVTVNPAPPMPSASDVSRCGPGSVTLNATGTGGDLKWYATNSSTTVLSTGASYTVSVTGDISYFVSEANTVTGCESPRKQVNVTVTAPPTLAITPGGLTTFCEGGSVVLDANALPTDPSYVSFSWSPGGATTPSISANPSVTTVYTVTANDGVPVTGCSNTATITVTVNPKPTIDSLYASPATTCSGGAVQLVAKSMAPASFSVGEVSDVTLSSLSGYGMYFSTTAAVTINTVDVYPSTAGTLTVQLRNGTTVVDTRTFTIVSGDISTTVTKTLTLNFAVPANTTGWNLYYPSVALYRGEGTYAYPYSSNGFTITGNTIDGNNITGGTRYYFYNWNVTAPADNSAAYSWQWAPGTIPAGNIATVNPTASGNYSVTVTNTLTTCSRTSSLVPVSVLPVGANATPTANPICAGSSTTLNANGTGGTPLSYSWTVAGNPTVIGTTASISVSPAVQTTYEVTVTDPCNNSATSQVTINVNALPTVTVNPTTATICQPGSAGVGLTAGGADTYAWSPAAGLSATTGAGVTAAPGGTTTYTVTGTDGNGCINTATSTITVNYLVQGLVANSAPGTVCAGASSTLTASASVYGPVANYQFAASTGAALDPMTGATTIVGISTDDAPMNTSNGANTTAGPGIPIGFDFNFSGGNYTYFAASPDGWIKLGNDATAAPSQFSNTNGTTSLTNTPKIYPYWDDVATGTAGYVKYVVNGTAPDRILVVEWYVTIPRNTTGAPNSTFQAWLYETSGKVEFRYGTMNTGAMSASVGLTSTATQYQSVTVSSNTASNSTPNDANAGQPASGTMYTFTIPAVASSNFSWMPGSLTGNSVSVTPAVGSNLYTVTALGTGSCTTDATASVVVNPATVITADAAPDYQLVAQNSTATPLTVTATGTGTVTYQWYSNATNSSLGGTPVGSGSSYAPSTAAPSLLYYYAVASSDCGLDTSSVVSVEVVDANTNLWTGNAGSNWSTPGSWSLGAVPTALNNATIPTGATPYPVLSATSTAKNLEIQAGATVSLNGQTLNIVEAVDPTGTGTFIGSHTSNLSVGATSTLRFATGSGALIKNLTINGGTTTLATALDVTGGTGAINNNSNGVVTVASGAVLASNGNLTFKSNASGTARLAQGSAAGGYVTGNVTVERYIPGNAQRAWRFLSVPTSGTQKIKQAWQEGGTASNYNPKPGFGTGITSNTTPYATLIANGFDEYTTKASMQRFNSASGVSGAWVDITATQGTGTTGNIATTGGYAIYIRGDRTQTASGSVTSTTPTTLRTTGPLYTGDQANISIGSGRFDVIGNIYVSPIDFLGLNRVNMANTFYKWDPKLVTGTPPNQTLGGYVTFSLANGFVGVPNSSSYGITPTTTIQTGEAVMVQANAGGGSIGMREAAKVTGNGVNYFRPVVGYEKLKANLYTVATDNTETMADANVSVFDGAFSNAVDGDDAIKLSNAGENFAIRRSNAYLVVEGRQVVTSYDTTYFWMWNMRQGEQYKLELVAENMNVTGRSAFLIDNFTSTTTQLDLVGGTTNYNFVITADPMSSVANRFRVVYRQVDPAPVPVTFVSISANKAGNAVKVDWKVAGERGIKNYEIERSADRTNFTTIATIAAKANNGGEASYVSMDESPLNGNNFYRIKSVGIDGTVKYTIIAQVLVNVKSAFVIAPNPVEGSVVNLQIRNKAEGRYTIRLLSNAGQTIVSKVVEHAGGNSNQIINLPASIARGSYQMEIVSPDKTKEVETLFINTLK